MALKKFAKFKAAPVSGSKIEGRFKAAPMSGSEIFRARPCGALKYRKFKPAPMSGSEIFRA